jgi:hypothetical protein
MGREKALFLRRKWLTLGPALRARPRTAVSGAHISVEIRCEWSKPETGTLAVHRRIILTLGRVF